jgi:predicted metal-dependent phosphoesterase TrpH
MEILKNSKTVFHVHTYYSIDSFLKPVALVDVLYKANVDNVIITDHNSVRGALEAKEYAEKTYSNKFNVIIGEEVKTDIGDIIGFPIKEEIQLKDHKKVIDEIKAQGGYVCLPHPYKSHDMLQIHDYQFIDTLDFVEVFNSRISQKQNQSAKEMAKKYNKKIIVGSDAHLKKELLNTFIVFNDNFEIKDYSTSYTSKRNLRTSQMIQDIKRKNIAGVVKYLSLAILNM